MANNQTAVPEIQPREGDTPRTDARWNELYDQGGNTITWFEVAERVRDFARQLERELAEAKRELEAETALATRTMVERDALERRLAVSAKPLISPGVINDYQALAEKAIERIADHHDDTTEALLVIDVRKAIEKAVSEALSTTQPSDCGCETVHFYGTPGHRCLHKPNCRMTAQSATGRGTDGL